MSLIQFNKVQKAFGSKSVLNNLSLNIARGESLVLIGRSGTGKSVTLKCFLGLMQPDAGTITLNGQSLIGLDAKARRAQMDKVGMLFQRAALFDSLPVWKNIGLRLLERRQAGVRAQVDGLLAL